VDNLASIGAIVLAMSLAINEYAVTAVLLADGWWQVKPESFFLDSYEFMENGSADSRVSHPGGRSGICPTGFSFVPDDDSDQFVKGPLTSIIAVREHLVWTR